MQIVVGGAGAWGTALAIHLARRGHGTTLVPRRLEHALDIARARENAERLPGVRVPDSLQVGLEWAPVLLAADLVLLACPSAHLRALLGDVAAGLRARGERFRGGVLTLCKGLESGTGKLPADLVREALADVVGPGAFLGCLSGPSNAAEVAAGRPTALVLGWEPFREDERASALEGAKAAQAAVAGGPIRVYRSEDLRGVELGGCLKNVYAIAAGLGDGLEAGDNAKAALLCRVLVEMGRIGEALGGRAETFAGLSGFGDLVATAHGRWSRNRTFGERVARGDNPASLVAPGGLNVEGFRTSREFLEICRARGLEAPILEQVVAVVHGGRRPDEAAAALLGRALRPE